MVSAADFLGALGDVLGRPLDDEKRAIVISSPRAPLIVAAGPGTGKTTAITSRALKFVFVDRVDPGRLLLSTFTKKAAAELRSRLLGWGVAVREVLLARITEEDDRSFLSELDINRFITGTLDSLAEQLLDRYRDFETVPPVVLDEFVANSVLLRDGLFANRLYEDQDLADFAASHGRAVVPRLGRPTVADLTTFARVYVDRINHDLIDLADFAGLGPGPAAISRVIEQYQTGLAVLGQGVTDFSLLERLLLDRIRAGALNNFASELDGIFVDEFQDTNPLQEAIYYELGQRVGGRLTVVGDDDQSLYRFRGGTVELFRAAATRMEAAFGIRPDVRYLVNNYRAPRRPVDFTQDFIEADPDFQSSRIAQKPRVVSANQQDGLPILGVFRQDLGSLAQELSRVLDQLVNRRGLNLQTTDGVIQIRMADAGMPGDCAYIAHSVRDWTRSFMGQPPRPRLPFMLRQALQTLENPIQCFNPRGEDISKVEEIERLGGLMLECLDPGEIYVSPDLPLEVVQTVGRWRQVARAFVQTNPQPNQPTNLEQFVRSWAGRTPQTNGVRWPADLPLIDLFYQLLTWFPSLQDDPEKQVYLEVMARALTQSARVTKFQSRVVFDPPGLEPPSIKEAIRTIFVPLAAGSLELNEDIVESLPRTAVNFLTVHQAKGLEYPVVIVDVAAHFLTNHQAHRRLRFPEEIDEVYRVEDLTRPVGALRDVPFGTARDRAFDDLVRLYYVAYSRPQSLLILAGVDPARPSGKIRNVALGWTRTGVSSWRTNTPFVYI